MDTLTKQISEKIKEPVIPEYMNDQGWSMFNSGGVEAEVGEFLYGLVRAMKPLRILETGTHQGIASSYMALALKDNWKGHLETIEFEPIHLNKAKEKWTKLGVQDIITEYLISSLEFNPSGEYDILFLDTEPQQRFTEFNKFYPYVKPGGFIIIHDLNEQLGARQSPWEDFVEKFGDKILDNEIQIINIPSPRGLTIIQKFSPSMGQWKLRTGKI